MPVSSQWQWLAGVVGCLPIASVLCVVTKAAARRLCSGHKSACIVVRRISNLQASDGSTWYGSLSAEMSLHMLVWDNRHWTVAPTVLLPWGC